MIYVEIFRRPIRWSTPGWATRYTMAPVQDRPGMRVVDVEIKRWARPLIWIRNLWWELCARDLVVWVGERVTCHHCSRVDRLTGLLADQLRGARRKTPDGVYTCAACLLEHVWFLKGAAGSWTLARREVVRG